MNIDQTISDLSALSLNDRLRVVHALWDTLADDVDISITPAQQAELNRRNAAYESDPSTAITHEELMRRLQARLSCGR